MSESAIELVKVTKAFGPRVAVRDVSLKVPVGSCYGLIGPNGAGKTTTFSMMCGFLRPSSGELRVMGTQPLSPGALKGKVGALPQDAVLPPWARVGELLTFWAKLSNIPNPEAAAQDVLARVTLSETWKIRANALSHGMAKRVAMAQALLGEPPVVLLDEPTAGLDPKIAAHVRDLIRKMKGRQTVVVSSHNLQELEELCDEAAILDRGALVSASTMSELTSKSDEFSVQIARGEVPLDQLRAQKSVTVVSLDEKNQLTVRFAADQAKPEEVISQTLQTLLGARVLVLSVTRGKRLEERVLQLT
ncbi:MAG: ABC transporter ATP-binding protein [Myxococcaceae bacterium]